MEQKVSGRLFSGFVDVRLFKNCDGEREAFLHVERDAGGRLVSPEVDWTSGRPGVCWIDRLAAVSRISSFHLLLSFASKTLKGLFAGTKSKRGASGKRAESEQQPAGWPVSGRSRRSVGRLKTRRGRRRMHG